jgi:RNA polymerase sigma-70 factor (ECF subfamily)
VETIELARAGDRDAIAVMWRIYHPQVLRLLTARRTRSPEDVASQVWIDVGRSLDRFEGDGADFRRWIFTIASRRGIDGHRRAARHRTIDLADWDQPTPGADLDLETATSLERALATVRRLPPATAEAVMLRIVNDLSFADVAAIMDRSEGAVRVLVHRGLNRLRELLSADEGASDHEVSHHGVTPGDLGALMRHER